MIGCHEEINETGKTLQENALIKADFIYKEYGLNCFADDTGLLVDALGGLPGVHSARYAGVQKNSDDNMKKLLEALQEKTNRKARFETVIALQVNTALHYFSGVVEGTIIRKKRGNRGFGYDPIFIPDGYNQTFAELPLKIKNKISHRGLAIKQLIRFLETLTSS